MASPTSVEALEQDVVHLLHTKRYDPSILPRLELFINYQVQNNFYDPDANLAVLKLYQFHPSKYNAQVVSKILIKALMSLPSTHFLCALYLIPERKQVDEPIPVISRLAALLESGKFRQFWAESGACRDLLESVPGSLAAVRDFMLDVMARTYRTVDLSTLVDVLDMDGSHVTELVSSRGWTISDGIVTVPGNEENQSRPPSMEEHLSFKQVASKML